MNINIIISNIEYLCIPKIQLPVQKHKFKYCNSQREICKTKINTILYYQHLKECITDFILYIAKKNKVSKEKFPKYKINQNELNTKTHI